MKLLALIALIILIYLIAAGIFWLIRHRKTQVGWVAEPRTDGDERQIWLTNTTEEVLFWPTNDNRSLTYDMAMIDAEYQAREYNRMRKELA